MFPEMARYLAPLAAAAGSAVVPVVIVVAGGGVAGAITYENYKTMAASETGVIGLENAGPVPYGYANVSSNTNAADGTLATIVAWPDNLPRTGDIIYVPPKHVQGDGLAVKDKDGTYVDKYGNKWRWDKTGDHWDVKDKDGKTIGRVTPDGRWHHGKDKMKQTPRNRTD